MTTSIKNILVSSPNASTTNVFLPYAWAVFKSYYEKHGSFVDRIQWLDPLFRRQHVLSQVNELIKSTRIDLVALSCYTWNWHLNLEIAQLVKSNNNNALVIAGGPHPDHKDPFFFVNYPYIDAVVIKDGEVPIMRILDALATDTLELSMIQGLCLPGTSRSERQDTLSETSTNYSHLYTGPAELPVSFDHSPYRMQIERLKSLVGPDDKVLAAILETNRGCPYSCNYCDWGSSTMSKLRKFEMSRVIDDIESLALLHVSWLYWADANVGILPRDLDIADYIVSTRSKHGYPSSMIYASAKNNPERTVDIVRRLYKGGLVPGHWLALQHTDEAVLRIADRSNIPVSQYVAVVTSLLKQGIPVFPQFILGMPGDTLDKWKTCVTNMMEWGMHDDYWVPVYSILPNAPAADPSFMQTWEINTIDRELIEPWGLRLREGHEVIRSRIIVSFKGFPLEDWVKASMYTAIIQALHNLAITRLPALYLNKTYGVSFRQFYDLIVNSFLATTPWNYLLERLQTLYHEFVTDYNLTDDYKLSFAPDIPWFVTPAKGLFIEIMHSRSAFMSSLSSFLVSSFPDCVELASVVQYQSDLLMSHDRDPTCIRPIELLFDWPHYFSALEPSNSGSPTPIPRRFNSSCIAMIRPHSSPWLKSEADPLTSWIEYILANPNSMHTSNFQHAQVSLSQPLP